MSEGRKELSVPVRDWLQGEFGEDWEAWAERLELVFLWPALPRGADAHRALKDDYEHLKRAVKSLSKARSQLQITAERQSPTLSINLQRDGVGLELWLEELDAIIGEASHAAAMLRTRAHSLAPTGGRDAMANMLAKWIAEAMDMHDEPVTFGQSWDGEPSTRYCRLVCFALSTQGFDAHWRRPAEHGYRNLKPRKNEPERTIPKRL